MPVSTPLRTMAGLGHPMHAINQVKLLTGGAADGDYPLPYAGFMLG